MADDFLVLKKSTQARIGLPRTGSSIRTGDLLDFRLAHASARDSVLSHWDLQATQRDLAGLGVQSLQVQSQVATRMDFLMRPDLGRLLRQDSRLTLNALHQQVPDGSTFDLAVVLSDGLSSLAIQRHAIELLKVLLPLVQSRLTPIAIAPIVLAPFSRVALSDEIGYYLKAAISLMLIGERPGLSSADSLGAYLTYDPKPGRTDAQRNCVSNIRPPHGLSYVQAANKIAYLISESRRLKLSGISLKEGSLEQRANLT